MSNSVIVRSLTAQESELVRIFHGGKQFKRYGIGGMLLTAEYAARADEIRVMSFRHDDIIVQTYAKSGTAITQEIVWLMQNNLDYKSASESAVTSRCHFLESSTLFTRKETPFDDLPSPRCAKTHLSLDLLPANVLDTCRLIHVARDPREAAIAFNSIHNQIFKDSPFAGDLKDYWKLFEKDLILFTPYFTSAKQAWAARDHPNMLFLFYDEFVNDLPSTIKRIAEFLGKVYSEEDITKLTDYTKQYLEPYLTNTLNKGEGSWREHFDEDSRRRAQEWMQRHLSDTDLQFPSTFVARN